MITSVISHTKAVVVPDCHVRQCVTLRACDHCKITRSINDPRSRYVVNFLFLYDYASFKEVAPVRPSVRPVSLSNNEKRFFEERKLFNVIVTSDTVSDNGGVVSDEPPRYLFCDRQAKRDKSMEGYPLMRLVKHHDVGVL